MKQDPLNEFLKQHADAYRVRPSAHAFEGLMGRRAAGLRRKRKAIWFSLSIILLGVVSFLVGKEYGQSASEKDKETIVRVAQLPAGEVPGTKAGQGKHSSQPLVKQAIEEKPVNKIQADPEAVPKSFVTPARIKAAHHIPLQKSVAKKSGIRNQESATPEGMAPRNISDEEKIVFPEQGSLVESVGDTMWKKDEQALPETVDTSLAMAADSIPENLRKLPIIPARTYKWSISAIYSSQVLSELYSMNSEADLLWLNTRFKESDRKGKSRKAFTAGLKLERNFGKHFGLSGGLLYTKIFFQKMPFFVTGKKNPPNVYTGVVPNANKISATSAAKVSYSYDESLTYLDAPLMLYYRQHHKKMIYYAGAGVSCAYLLNTQTIIFDSSAAVKVDDAAGERFNKLLLFTNFSAGLGYQILPRWSISAGPVARLGMNGIYDKAYCARKSNFMMSVEGGVKFLF